MTDIETPSPSFAMPTWALCTAAVLAVATVVRLGFSANSIAWAVVQVVLVGVAADDFENRRVRNVVTIPMSAAAVGSRALLERSALTEIVIAGCVIFAFFLALALVLRGGVGMGDVKLAAMLGFLLGWKVLPALVIGAVAGGIVAAVLITRGGGRRATMAYGPYLALGAAIVILVSQPPPLL